MLQLWPVTPRLPCVFVPPPQHPMYDSLSSLSMSPGLGVASLLPLVALLCCTPGCNQLFTLPTLHTCYSSTHQPAVLLPLLTIHYLPDCCLTSMVAIHQGIVNTEVQHFFYLCYNPDYRITTHQFDSHSATPWLPHKPHPPFCLTSRTSNSPAISHPHQVLTKTQFLSCNCSVFCMLTHLFFAFLLLLVSTHWLMLSHLHMPRSWFSCCQVFAFAEHLQASVAVLSFFCGLLKKGQTSHLRVKIDLILCPFLKK